jgi:hypothetical protein
MRESHDSYGRIRRSETARHETRHTLTLLSGVSGKNFDVSASSLSCICEQNDYTYVTGSDCSRHPLGISSAPTAEAVFRRFFYCGLNPLS